jgi:transglutaminase-like putative cysteine protease
VTVAAATSGPRPPAHWAVLVTPALALATILHAPNLPLWVMVLAALAGLWRFAERARPALRPSRPLLVALALCTFALLAATQGQRLIGAGGAVALVAFVWLKLLETRRREDAQLVSMLVCFLVVVQVLLDSSLVSTVLAAAAFVCGVAALARSTARTDRAPTWGASLWRAARLVGWSMVPAVLLFLLVPRPGSGFGFAGARLGTTGLGSELRPGSVARLVNDDTLAFRVDFPDDRPPARSQWYWRAMVLWRSDGMHWSRGDLPDDLERQEERGWRETRGGVTVRQHVTLEPQRGRWLVALDAPITAPRGAGLEIGHTLSARPSLTAKRGYEVTSRILGGAGREDRRVLALATNIHAPVPPRVIRLARRLAGGARDPIDVAERILEHFATEGYVYSRSPGVGGGDQLSRFLFETRRGFCGHYASAFGVLMRLVGVPTRVVMGFRGGEWNPWSGTISVRNSDAHAWCEFWNGSRWDRVDPTRALGGGGEGEGTGGATGGGTGDGGAGLSQQLSGWLLWLDTIEARWDRVLLTYGAERQRELLDRFGLTASGPAGLLLLLAVGLAICGVIGAVYLRSIPGARDPRVRLYDRVCERLAAAGLPREPWEGPVRYGRRAACRFPEAAERLQRFFTAYAEARYGRHETDQAARDSLRALREAARSARVRSRGAGAAGARRTG